MIAELWRYIRSLFGVRYVTLYEGGGGFEVRPIIFLGGKPCADYVGWGIRIVHLLDGGALGGGYYVKRWEPYEPKLFGAVTWPVPPASPINSEDGGEG